MTKRLFIFAFFTGFLQVPVESQCDKNTLNVGSTLFSESDLLKDCWSTEHITLLTFRMVLEDVLPSPNVLHVKGEEFVIEVVDYFKLVLEVVRRISDVNTKHLMLMALSDLLGVCLFASFHGDVKSFVVFLRRLFKSCSPANCEIRLLWWNVELRKHFEAVSVV